MNNVSLIGRMTKDPLLRRINNEYVVRFILVVDKDIDDHLIEDMEKNDIPTVEYIQLVAKDDHAIYLNENILQGDLLSVVGRLSSRDFIDKYGHSRTMVEVVVEKVNKI